ncbi:MAG: hypothetical protein Q8Q60_04595 [Candidatus Chromulinivorax sp.]|nr:hypothetical protein [Candidatus Chromulinivorax sp.]
MKQYVTMLSMESGGYRFVEKMDHKFGVLAQIAGDDFRPDELIEWSMSDSNTAEGNEWVYIRKERGVIALYDVSDSMDETYTGEYLDPAKCFEMSLKNFAEILFEWEKLRVSRPDIILIVIHEDNHVSLEANPRVIKEYQDAGYVFDFNKK